jgi:CheY-like chemotaxis protein
MRNELGHTRGMPRSDDRLPRTERVLVVENDPHHERLMRTLLEREGYSVVTVWNGQWALAELESRGFDLVLIDGRMPVMDGLTTARRIRNNPTWNKLPLIAVTGQTQTGDRNRYLDAGMDDYISKPFQGPELVGKVRAWLDGAFEDSQAGASCPTTQGGQNTRPQPARTDLPSHLRGGLAPAASAPIFEPSMS